MLDKLKNLFKKPEPTVPPKATAAPKARNTRKPKVVEPVVLSDKEKATAQGEPWVSIIKVDIDPNNINAGSFLLDWNDKFLLNLIKAGYKQKAEDTDQVIIDRWFQTVCRNIALEIYEQKTADPQNRDIDDLRRVSARDLGNGRTEIS